jgi:Icc-related predicted phosphoesterase
MSTQNINIAAIADIHVHEITSNSFTDIVSQISDKADILVIGGDLTNQGLPEEAEHLLTALTRCKIPIVGVLGNHDYDKGKESQIKKILSPKIHFLEDEAYTFEGVGFAGVKGFGGGFGGYLLSSFGEKAVKDFVSESVNEALSLERSLSNLQTEKKIVVLHYSPIQQTVTFLMWR